MKNAIFLSCFMLCAPAAQAQTTVSIGADYYVVTGATLSIGNGSFVNNGTYIDTTGNFNVDGGVTFSGSGLTTVHNINFNAGPSLVQSGISVYNTASVGTGTTLDADNNLFVRSDLKPGANLVDNGALTNNVKGMIARASVTDGSSSYPSALSLDVSGTEMLYQWQSSPDNLTWTDVTGATAATYNALVTATVYYRCNLSASNTSYHESTPGVQLRMGGPNGVNTIANSTDNIVVSPNPNTGTFSLKGTFGALTNEKVTIVVTDILGNVIYSEQVAKVNGQLDEQVALNKMAASGVYLLSLHTAGADHVARITVAQ